MSTLAISSISIIISDPCKDAHVGITEMLRKKLKDCSVSSKSCFSTTAQLIDGLKQNPDSCIILNPHMEGFDMNKTPHYIKQSFPEAKIIAATVFYSHLCVKLVKESIFNAYLLKSASGKQYEEALQAIYVLNEPYLHSKVKDIMLNIPNLSLKEYEWQTFYLMLQFKTHHQIETAIHKSASSVSAYMAKIYQVTHTTDFLSFVKFAIKNHFTSAYELEWWANL